MRRWDQWLLAVVLAMVGVRLDGGQLLLPIDSATSTLRVQMRVVLVTTTTSTDTVPVSGFLLLDQDTNGTPAQISLRNYDMHALRNLQFANTVLWVAKVNTTVSGVQVYDGYPGPQAAYFPLSGGSFNLSNVFFLVRGRADYSGATAGSRDLYSSTPRALSGITGTIQNVNGTNVVHADFSFAFDPITIASPIGDGVVNIFGTGSVNARADVGAPPPPPPVIGGGVQGGQLALSWPSSLWPTPVATNTPAGYWLFSTTNLTVPSGWVRTGAAPSDDGTSSSVRVPLGDAQRFYRLEWR